MDAVLAEMLIPHVKESEGYYARAYRCPAGKLTIGYGHNLDARPITTEQGVRLGIPLPGLLKPATLYLEKAQAEGLMLDELEEVYHALIEKNVLQGLDAARKAVLIDMGFNMGVPGLMKFHRMLEALKEHRYMDAADEMVDSAWYNQVGRRSKKLVKIMQTGAGYGCDRYAYYLCRGGKGKKRDYDYAAFC